MRQVDRYFAKTTFAFNVTFLNLDVQPVFTNFSYLSVTTGRKERAMAECWAIGQVLRFTSEPP